LSTQALDLRLDHITHLVKLSAAGTDPSGVPVEITSPDSSVTMEERDDVHDAFMTLPPYTRTSEDEVHSLGLGVRNCSHRAISDPLS
jgi:hypothetical protein